MTDFPKKYDLIVHFTFEFLQLLLRPFFDEVDSSPTNVTAFAGETAYLQCAVRNVGNKSVSFLKIVFKTNFFANLCDSNLKYKKSVRTFTARRKMQRKKASALNKNSFYSRRRKAGKKCTKNPFFCFVCLGMRRGWGGEKSFSCSRKMRRNGFGFCLLPR